MLPEADLMQLREIKEAEVNQLEEHLGSSLKEVQQLQQQLGQCTVRIATLENDLDTTK